MKPRTLATIIAIVAISAGLAGYTVGAQAPSILHVFADSSMPANIVNCSNFSCFRMSAGPFGGFQGGFAKILGGPFGPGSNLTPVSIASGTNIVLTSTSGQFRVVGNPKENGTASGTITFTVKSDLSRGYILTITSGSITVGGTTYTISSGAAQMGPFARAISGEGTTTSSGAFLISAQAHGNFSGSTTAREMLDLKAGSTEYAILLSSTLKG